VVADLDLDRWFLRLRHRPIKPGAARCR
jgi:hypothetical protein